MDWDIGVYPRWTPRSPTRLVPLAVVVLLFLAMGCSPNEPPAEPPETPTATPETPSSDPAEQRSSCTSPDGYAIDYPAEWATNDEPIDDVAPCSVFDPEPDQLRTEGLQLPADIAVMATVEAAPFHDVAAEDPHAEELDRREATVHGREAVRIEQEATGEGLYPQGQRSTVWAVKLEGVTFVARTFDVGAPDYATKQKALDEMVASVRFDDDILTTCSAQQLDADLEEQEGLPEPVARTRTAIAQAAVDCDYTRLAELAGEDFSYSFGADGDPVGHWRRGEAGGAEPLRYLAELLDRPYGTDQSPEGSQYVWPSAFAHDDWAAVPEEDREALKPLYDEEDFADYAQFGGYAGYRVGIDGEGSWLFFIAGD